MVCGNACAAGLELYAPAGRRILETMKIIESHFHWWPRSIFEDLCDRPGYPRAERDGNGGYHYYRAADCTYVLPVPAVWFDLDDQFAYMDTLGHDVAAVGSIGPFSVHFCDLPVEEGRAAAIQWNEEMATHVRSHPGRFWATAAIPLNDIDVAMDVLEDAAGRLGLVGVNIPGSIGDDPRIDHPRLEPFYDRVEALGLPLFLHPTDALFADPLEGYGGALHRSVGRIMEASVATARLIFSGIMERHPNLKVVVSHTGGALPYQSGRLDKNGTGAKLPELPSTYLKRMYTDMVSPHTAGMRFAIEYFGAGQVMYGTDYPCWDSHAALRLFEAIDLSPADKERIFNGNIRRLMNLDAPVKELSLT
jgi:aminocarboxymuconate-semialdehyde decarboxylase